MMARLVERDDSIQHGNRPIMYTFFEWIHPSERETEIPDIYEENLISEWKSAWKGAGWEPVVLTVKDARKHEKFDYFYSKLQKITGPRSKHLQLTFVRWFAVAAVGGGFMCDYNVFPISKAPKSLELPHQGKFSIYCKIQHPANASMPCLMSGDANEWIRVASVLLEKSEGKVRAGYAWSDAMALVHLRETDTYMLYDAVLEGGNVPPSWKEEKARIFCKRMIGMHAVRFPIDRFVTEDSLKSRTVEIRRFLEAWAKLCTPNGQLQENAMQNVA
mmetsp:Transcript_18007/g.26646  ORF Transcript_18007/g.26646 Transcript_18007/m.26646 type:complete len:274 (+) Transcript_18007:43-864(+)